MSRLFRWFALFSLVGSVSAEAAERSSERPRVGVALGGGAARGMAHIGFLEWLEEHRVPVDFVAGTSMGGLIGGAYASGMSTKELRALMRDMDWDLVFLSDSPFKYKDFRRKEDKRLYPSQIELGLKGGIKLPAGMNAGQQIELALDRIAAPYSAIASFDELPIPFRAVAVDLRSGEEVVLGSGSLSLAMRATMAIPGVFTPVAMDDRLLVDGGTLNNVPADVARDMGADVVIAVNVASATDGPVAPENMFDVLGQTVDVMMAAGVKRVLGAATVVVTPDLRGITGMDWRKSDELADRGYAAAEAMRDQLSRYSIDEASYRAWQDERTRRRPVGTPVIRFVRVEGVPEKLGARIRERFEQALGGEPFDPGRIDRQVLLLTGSDRYAVVRYRLETDAASGGTGLVINAEVKPYGPPFLLPAVDLENIDSNNFAMNLRGRFVFMDTLVPDSEIRIDGAVGTRLDASVELYRRLGRTPLFVAPRAYWARRSENAYDAESRFLAEYRETTSGLGADVGIDFGPRSQLRFGYDVADLRVKRRIGEPTLPEVDGLNRFLSLRWVFDGQTSPIIPTHGLYLRSRLSRYFDTPDFVTQLSEGELKIDGPKDYYQAELRLSVFRSTGGQHRLFFGASGGTSFGDPPGYNTFELGGLLRLGAFNVGEIRGNNYVLAQGGALFRVLKLPDVLGGNGYLGAWLETGSAFDLWEEAHVEWQVSGGFVLETFVGPVFLGGSVSLNGSGGRVYVNVGPFLR
jgi:NTE family protein